MLFYCLYSTVKFNGWDQEVTQLVKPKHYSAQGHLFKLLVPTCGGAWEES